MHESEHKFSIRKWKTIKLNESYQLVTKVVVLNSHSRKIHSIFLTTIAVAARSRYSNFWVWCSSVALGFLFLSPRRGSFFLLPARRGSGQFSTAMDISGSNQCSILAFDEMKRILF
jgi:hypothetical protein